MTDLLRIPPVPTTTATPPGERAVPAADAPGFRALLERLQRLAAPAPTPPEVTTADDLRAAVRDAASSFATAMDLRRQLEEAFRRHAP